MRKQNVIIIVTLCLVFLLSGVATAAEKGSKLQIHGSSFLQSYPGTIISSHQAKLAFRVSGPLIKVLVKPGDKVKKGQLVMQVDPRDFEDSIRVLEAQLAGAEAQRDRALRDFDRAQTLFDQHVSATADFDRAKGAYEVAFSGVAIIEAQLQMARHRLKDTSLRAPFAGVITTQSAENYEMIRAGAEVLAIHDISNLEVEIKIPENEIVRYPLRVGQEVRVKLAAIADSSFTAKLVEWNSAADPVTRTYALRFAFTALPQFHVLPGMTAEVSLINEASQPSSYHVPEQQNVSGAIM
ncbi:RND family efflux transporter, MFP subunit [Desulfuromusa kysingii]|uniref:RND family efflux transporter, MFP subunit n=1 Tax=Desulfuromusa kysingii TaxID=37625 RepID=A0A1H4ATF5_9BACT|nr:efflux RND transporter periplasmic adaptor subunit [Desulfuromusa kysingii]SEA39141.1 RND family efflux transporter, MFP subunit [Desulfuromusa kysingii]